MRKRLCFYTCLSVCSQGGWGPALPPPYLPCPSPAPIPPSVSTQFPICTHPTLSPSAPYSPCSPPKPHTCPAPSLVPALFPYLIPALFPLFPSSYLTCPPKGLPVMMFVEHFKFSLSVGHFFQSS